MYKGRRLGLLPFFITLSIVLYSHPKKVIYRGFVLQNPSHLLKSVNISDISALKKNLKERGFFRKVSVVEKNEAIVVSVKEYPLVKKINILGNTIYKKPHILDYFNIKIGNQFNARSFQTGLQEFYQKSKKDGYTHYTVDRIRVQDNGEVDILINEGLLRKVKVENEAISQRIINHFFKDLVNHPFNSHRTKYILEELLFTEAFYKIDSEVKRKDGQVYLNIKIDKKRLKRLRNTLEYSSYGGFKLTNLTGLVKKNNSIQFVDAWTEYFTHKGSKLVHLNLDFYDYRKQLQKNRFSLKIDFFYSSFSEVRDLFVVFKPSYTIYLIKNISLAFFVNGGLNKNLSAEPNALIAETGFDLGYHFRSPLDRLNFGINMELKTSLLENYTNIRLMAALVAKFSQGEFRMYGQWNDFSGKAYGFNTNLIPLDQVVILKTEDIFSRDSYLISGQLNSEYLWGWLKIGILGQYFNNHQSKVLYGLNTFLNIKGIPLNLILFWQDKKPRILARISLSF